MDFQLRLFYHSAQHCRQAPVPSLDDRYPVGLRADTCRL